MVSRANTAASLSLIFKAVLTAWDGFPEIIGAMASPAEEKALLEAMKAVSGYAAGSTTRSDI
ncbi:hypothetical protein D3C84_931940 [compost metagenome]